MISVKFDNAKLKITLKNTVQYSQGFIEGVELSKVNFNQELANFTLITLQKYIDSQARMNPLRLHHMYEWGRAGNASSRLFEFDTKVTNKTIRINGKFLPSKSISSTSSEPFVNKASIMENAITVVIEPKNSDVLVFEDNGETVFTTKTIYIDHPGGDEVAGGFGSTIDNFFENYFTNGLLKPLIDKLSKASEFSQSFPAGTRSGKNVGVNAGKKYLKVEGGVE
jgi:hypothetical protein